MSLGHYNIYITTNPDKKSKLLQIETVDAIYQTNIPTSELEKNVAAILDTHYNIYKYRTLESVLDHFVVGRLYLMHVGSTQKSLFTAALDFNSDKTILMCTLKSSAETRGYTFFLKKHIKNDDAPAQPTAVKSEDVMTELKSLRVLVEKLLKKETEQSQQSKPSAKGPDDPEEEIKI